METSRYTAPASRPLVVVVGAVVAVMGAALLALFGFAIYLSRGRGFPPSNVVVALCILGGLGLALTAVGVRLLIGKRRRDGGLFSPWVLRLGGVIFLFGPVAAVLNRSWFGLLEAAFALSAAVTCFVLANRREEAAADPGAPNNRWRGP